MAGRPSTYSLELVTELCERIATSERGVSVICREDADMPSLSVVYKWLADPDKKEFVEMYTRAREDQADMMANNILKIADESQHDTIVTEKGEIPNNEWINRSRLRVDARKWLLAKLQPRKYGDKIDVTSDGKEIKTTPIIVADQKTKDLLDGIGE